MRVQCAVVESPLHAATESPTHALIGNQLPPVLEYRYAFINRCALGFQALNLDPTDPLNLDGYRRWKNLTYEENEFGPPGPGPYDFTFVSSTGAANVPTSNLPNDFTVREDNTFEDPTPVAANMHTSPTQAQNTIQNDGHGTATHSRNPDTDNELVLGFEECTLDTEWIYATLFSSMKTRLLAEDFTPLWNGKIDRNIWYDEFPTGRAGSDFGINLDTTVVIADIDTGYTGNERTNTQAASSTGGDGRGSNFDLANVTGTGNISGKYGNNHLLLSRVQVRGLNFPPDGLPITAYETAGGFLLIRDQRILLPGVIYELPMPSFGGLGKSGPYPNGQTFVTAQSSVQVTFGDLPGGFTRVTSWL